MKRTADSKRDACALFAGVFLALVAPASLRSETPHASPRRVLCLGDSTTVPTAAPDFSWPRQLEDRLNRDWPGQFVVLNHLPEADSAVIERALPSYLDRYKPDLLIAMVGKDDPSRVERLVQSLGARGIPLVLMRYPGAEAARRPKALEAAGGVIFVDNKRSFDAAGASARYGEYFQDRAFGSWGHATPKGNLLIAENAARAVLARFPGERALDKTTAAQRVDAYRTIARAHAELDDEAGALGSLGLLLELVPDDRDALRRTARISADEGLLWEALHYADRAEAHREAGELRLHLGDLVGAEENFERGFSGGLPDPALSLLLAQARRERPADALASARQAARAEGGSPRRRAEAHLLVGKILADQGDAAGAEASLKRALSLAGDDLDALHAMVRLKRGRKNEARFYAERAERAVGKTPSWRRPAAHRYAARLWLELNDHARAGDNLIRALQADPDDFDALLALSRIKDKLPESLIVRARRAAGSGTVDPAPPAADEASLFRALENDEHDLDALRLLIERARDQGRFPQASALAQRFLRAVPMAPLWQRESAYRLGADIWLELGRESRAFLSLSRALELNPDSIAARRKILRLRRPVEEDSVFGSSDLGGFANRYVRAAAMRVELGDHDGALASIQSALELSPGDIGALQLRSRLKRAD